MNNNKPIDDCLSIRDDQLFIEDYAQVCTETLLKELPANGIETSGLTLQIEPGRSLHGDAGIHLTTVQGIK